MIFDELNTAFRWYTLLSRQNRYKNACASQCGYALPSVCNDILPFQIKTTTFGTPTTWKVIYLDGTITIPAIGAIATYDASGWSAGSASFNLTIFLNFLINGANSKTVTSQTSTDGAFNSLVNFYNGLGYGILATYNSTTNIFTLQNPTDVGTAGNGKLITGFTVGGPGSPTGTGGGATFSGGVDSTTGTELDISDCSRYINKHTEENGDIYLTYNGGSISGCIPKQFDCGKWYSTLEDENGVIFYSEVFEVLLIENADTVYPTLDPSLFSAWRFYDDIEKQTRYKSYCESACNFYLIVDKARLLPFMFRSASIGNIQSFKLIGVDDGCELDIPIVLLNQVTYLGYDYVYYSADDIDDLPCGKYYVKICDETQCWYSELINLVDLSAVSEIDYLLTDDGDILMTDDGEGITIS